MAKKKRSRTSQARGRTGPGPRAAGPAQRGPATQAETAEPPAPRVTPAEPGGPNRIARKEEARRQREALRRKMARRRLYRRLAWGAGAAAVLAGIVYLTVSGGGEVDAEEQRLLSQARRGATAAGCTPVEDVKEYREQDRGHVAQTPPLSSYPSQPPASGPHAGSTMPAGVYDTPPPIAQVLHSMEHGAVVIWYSPEAEGAELERIRDWFRRSDQRAHVLVAPYNYPAEGEAGKLPEGKQLVMTAWHRMQSCDSVSLPVAFSFVHNYATRPGADYKGEAPEPGAPL